MAKKKDFTPMDKLTQGYEGFIKGKELDTAGEKKFGKALTAAATPPKKKTKPRSSK